jgi:branched-chain amino acid aminotransferase
MTLVPFDDRDGAIWFDGAMVPWREAKIHVLSHGLHYASAVFEGERAYSGNIFRLRAHTQRLIVSGKLLGFDIPYAADEIDAACNAVLKVSGLSDAYIRPLAWRGAEQLSVAAPQSRIHLMVACWAWPNLFGHDRMAGVTLDIARWKRPSPETAPTASKASGLYMIGTLARHEAAAKGFDDALMLDWRGQVAEGTAGNVFLVFDGEIHTPTPDCFLDGITRRTVMRLARNRRYKVVERAIMADELAKAEEVFLVGTAAEVTPVRQIGESHYAPGEITRTLLSDYETLVRQSSDAVDALMAAA